jgi:hypothetical protein
VNNELGTMWKEVVKAQFKSLILAFAWRDWWKPWKTCEGSQCASLDIQTGHLLRTCHKHYRLIQLNQQETNAVSIYNIKSLAGMWEARNPRASHSLMPLPLTPSWALQLTKSLASLLTRSFGWSVSHQLISSVF